MKPYMFFDWDNTAVDTLPHVAKYLNNRHDVNLTIQDIMGHGDMFDSIIKKHNSNFNLSWNETYLDIGKNFHASIELHDEVLPMPNMEYVIKKLYKRYRLVIVTSQQLTGLPVINHLIQKFVPGCISHVHCVWKYHQDDSKFKQTMSKKQFIQSIFGDKICFVDDSPKEVRHMNNTLHSYLFDPKNHFHYESDIPNRVRGWEEFGNKFL